MNSSLRLSLFLAVLSLTVACGHKSSDSGSSDSSDIKKIELDGVEYQVHSRKLDVVQQVSALGIHNESIDNAPGSVVTLVRAEHDIRRSKSLSDQPTSIFSGFISSLDVAGVTDPLSLKLEIEKQLADRAKPKSLVYNKAKVNVYDILETNQMQCYSGSTLFALAALSLEKNHSGLQNTVLIYRPGHVLPGYVGADQQGDLHLYGLESTVDGAGQIDFGSIQQQIPDNVVVVEAKYALMADGLRGGLIDTLDLRRHAIEKTAADLHLIVSSSIMSLYGNDNGPGSMNPLNQAVFAFGSVDVPDGDQERIKADTLPMEESEPYKTMQVEFMRAPEPPSAKTGGASLEDRSERKAIGAWNWMKSYLGAPSRQNSNPGMAMAVSNDISLSVRAPAAPKALSLKALIGASRGFLSSSRWYTFITTDSKSMKVCTAMILSAQEDAQKPVAFNQRVASDNVQMFEFYVPLRNDTGDGSDAVSARILCDKTLTDAQIEGLIPQLSMRDIAPMK